MEPTIVGNAVIVSVIAVDLCLHTAGSRVYSNYFPLRDTSRNVNNTELINFTLNFTTKIHYLL